MKVNEHMRDLLLIGVWGLAIAMTGCVALDKSSTSKNLANWDHQGKVIDGLKDVMTESEYDAHKDHVDSSTEVAQKMDDAAGE